MSPAPGASRPDGPTGDLPAYLRPLAAHARPGDRPLPGPQAPDDRAPGLRGSTRNGRDGAGPDTAGHDAAVRDSAVLFLFTGTGSEDARLVVEERGARMRSQPGQFALPGGGAEPEDSDRVATALREAREEIGLDPRAVRVLGTFAAVAMPWRRHLVRPVLAWSPVVPDLHVADPREVERVELLPLAGADSLTDPRCRFEGRLAGRAVGPVFDLSGDRFVWGFTAALIAGALDLLGLGADRGTPWGPTVEIPAARRREGSRIPGPDPAGAPGPDVPGAPGHNDPARDARGR